MVWLVVFTEYQLHLRSEALRSCSEGQNFLFPCWNSILSFLLQMFRLTRPPEAQIRTNLRPSVASVGLFFSGDYALEYTATRSFRTWNGGTRRRKSGRTWCWQGVRHYDIPGEKDASVLRLQWHPTFELHRCCTFFVVVFLVFFRTYFGFFQYREEFKIKKNILHIWKKRRIIFFHFEALP